MARSRLQLPGLKPAGVTLGATAGARAGLKGVAGVARVVPEQAAARGAIGQEAYSRIRGAILDCTYLPGMALSEQAVSDQLGVSRAPVRDAFRRLLADGLIEVVPQRGTSVAHLSRARIADAIFVREAIECRAAELAAAAPLAERQALLAVLQRQRAAADQGDYGQHLSTDEELHHAILLLAGHPHAWGPLRLARTGMNRIRHIAIPELGSHRIAIDQHRTVVDAIVAGDAASAAGTMRAHIRSPLNFLDSIAQRHPEYFSED